MMFLIGKWTFKPANALENIDVPLPFDKVIIKDPDDGSDRAYDVEGFTALPIHQRVRAVLARQVIFFSGAEPVDVSVALRALRERG